MNRLLTVLPLIATAFFSSSCGSGSTEDRQAVRDSFNAYRAAIVKGDGAAAVNQFTAETKARYAKILALALNGSEQEVRSLGTFDKIAVLNARHNIDPKALQEMTAEALLSHGVSQGWSGKEGIQDLSIGAVRQSGNRAVGEVVNQGEPTPLRFTFLKENGQWKFDILSNLEEAAAQLKSAAQAQKMSEDEFIIKNLEAASGRRVADTIWQPINKKPQAGGAAHP
jgi:hypothetical protein